MTTLPELNLDQSDINPAASGKHPRASATYHVFVDYFAGAGVYVASREKSRRGETPVAKVKVTLPGIMFGDPGEIREDIQEAIRSHATAALGPA